MVFLFACLFFNPRLLFFFDRRGRFGLTRFEFLYFSGSVDQFLFAGVEGVAVSANFHLDFFTGGTDNERVSTATEDLGFGEVCRMNLCFSHA